MSYDKLSESRAIIINCYYYHLLTVFQEFRDYRQLN